MNTRYLVASAVAAAIVAPIALFSPEAGPTAHRVQDRKVLRHRERRQERLCVDRQQLVRRILEAEDPDTSFLALQPGSQRFRSWE
jgi:hypothetical protein